jgi:co-chaperonin GroES (HSP10)
MHLTPLSNRVLILPDKPKTKEGAIALPDGAQPPSTRGKVMGCGPDVAGLVIGDTVLMPQYGGTEVIINEARYRLLVVDEVIATIG